MTHAETHVEKSRSPPQGVAKVYPPCPISPRTLPWSVRAVSQVGGTTAGGLQSEEKLQQEMSLACEALSTPPQLLFKPVSASRTTLRRNWRAVTVISPFIHSDGAHKRRNPTVYNSSKHLFAHPYPLQPAEINTGQLCPINR